jgi:hypothetical protein
MRKPWLLLVAAGVIGCGGGQGAGSTSPPDMTPVSTSIVGQHGRVVDYFNLTPLAGFTVTDGANSATTDADGVFVLPAPMDTPLAPTVTGPSYSTLQLAAAHAAADDMDLGPITIPSSATFGTELSVLGADQSKALVQVIIIPTGACTSLAGGTLTVQSPSDASVAYFSPSGFPVADMFYDVMSHRPSAVLFNVEPGADIEVEMNHPTCKLAPKGTAYNGAIYDGVATTVATEPGDHNEALVLLAE